jgi:repressor LexA
VHRTSEASNGQIVVARLGDEVTVKRLRKVRGHIELQPENPDFETLVVPPGERSFAIEGIAVGLIRNTMLM